MMYNDIMKAKILKLSLLLLFFALGTLVIGLGGLLFFASYDIHLKDKEIATIRNNTPDKIESATEYTYNNLRTNLGLEPSEKDEYLCKFADERLKDITIKYEHDKEKIDNFAKDNVVRYKTVFENLASSNFNTQTGNSTAIINWVSSKHHFQAMINPDLTRYCVKCTKENCVLFMAQPQNP